MQFSILFYLNILLSCPTGEFTKAIVTNKKQLRINPILVFNSFSVTYSVNFTLSPKMQICWKSNVRYHKKKEKKESTVI